MESRPESDPLDALKSVAVEGNRRRRRNGLIMTMIILNGFMSFVASAGVLSIYLHQSDRDHKASISKKIEDSVRDRRVSDLYASANDTNAAVHRLEGSPAPPPITPATSPTTSVRRSATTTTTPRRQPASPPATSASTTTQPPSPPTTGAPAPPQPPPTTTTTRPCPTVTVPFAGKCIGGP